MMPCTETIFLKMQLYNNSPDTSVGRKFLWKNSRDPHKLLQRQNSGWREQRKEAGRRSDRRTREYRREGQKRGRQPPRRWSRPMKAAVRISDWISHSQLQSVTTFFTQSWPVFVYVCVNMHQKYSLTFACLSLTSGCETCAHNRERQLCSNRSSGLSCANVNQSMALAGRTSGGTWAKSIVGGGFFLLFFWLVNNKKKDEHWCPYCMVLSFQNKA